MVNRTFGKKMADMANTLPFFGNRRGRTRLTVGPFERNLVASALSIYGENGADSIQIIDRIPVELGRYLMLRLEFADQTALICSPPHWMRSGLFSGANSELAYHKLKSEALLVISQLLLSGGTIHVPFWGDNVSFIVLHRENRELLLDWNTYISPGQLSDLADYLVGLIFAQAIPLPNFWDSD